MWVVELDVVVTWVVALGGVATWMVLTDTDMHGGLGIFKNHNADLLS